MNKAVKLLDLIPRDYKGTVRSKLDYDAARERPLHISEKSIGTASMLKPVLPLFRLSQFTEDFLMIQT